MLCLVFFRDDPRGDERVSKGERDVRNHKKKKKVTIAAKTENLNICSEEYFIFNILLTSSYLSALLLLLILYSLSKIASNKI